MSGVEFETYIAGMLRALGLQVSETKATGDFGVDLIVAGTYAIQCKRQAKPVGVSAVQQVTAGARMHDCCEQTFVVSNQAFTPAAKQLAITTGCELYGRHDIHVFKERMRTIASADGKSYSSTVASVPARATKSTPPAPRPESALQTVRSFKSPNPKSVAPAPKKSSLQVVKTKQPTRQNPERS